MSEPTSALTFDDLILEVAIQLGVAYYGATGATEAVIPIDVHDLAECKRHVNNGIRRLIHDAPVRGWRALRPLLTVNLWPDVDADDDVTATGVYSAETELTTITASEAMFYSSMELKTITVTDVGDLTIAGYTSTTVITVAGDHGWVGNKTFSIEANGDYTLPDTFGGVYLGPISLAADTNSTGTITWTSPGSIRKYREVTTANVGDPAFAAVERSATDRRWQLLVHPEPGTLRQVQFYYEVHFDKLTTGTQTHPFGFKLDEAVKAAVKAAAERDAEDVLGTLNQEYRDIILPQAKRIDAQSAPNRLGYCGNPGGQAVDWRRFRHYRRRSVVTFNP